MIDPTAVRAAVEAFKLADASYTAHGVTAEERKIDLAIAERGGDPDAIAAAQAAQAAHNKEWHPAYTERQNTAKAVAVALDLDPVRFQRALPQY